MDTVRWERQPRAAPGTRSLSQTGHLGSGSAMERKVPGAELAGRLLWRPKYKASLQKPESWRREGGLWALEGAPAPTAGPCQASFGTWALE